MNTIFALNRVKEEPARYAALAAGLLPFGIFVANAVWPTDSSEGEQIVGRPPGAIFALAWISIVLILLFSTVIAMLRFDKLPLVLYCLIIAFIAIISIVWLYMNNYEKNYAGANNTILSLILVCLMFMVVSITAKSDKDMDNIHLMLGLGATIPVFWSISATTLGFLDANIPK